MTKEQNDLINKLNHSFKELRWAKDLSCYFLPDIGIWIEPNGYCTGSHNQLIKIDDAIKIIKKATKLNNFK